MPSAANLVPKAYRNDDRFYTEVTTAGSTEGLWPFCVAAKIAEVRAVCETNVFGVWAVYQAMPPFLRESSDARIVNVSSGAGSLPDNATPGFAYRPIFGPVYPTSKAALSAMTLAMIIELESTGIKVNLVSPCFTKTNLNGCAGAESLENGSREVVRVTLPGPDGPTDTFTRWENVTIPR